ncbi:MAG: NAD(P)/FAD-dependent oxidoreductase [Acidimicrobiales bacterium]
MTTLTSDDHVVVVGAGLAGWRLCEALRHEGYDGAITLIGAEADPPYDRPPLSKQVLAGKWSPDQTTLATPERLAAAAATTHFGVAATGLDVEGAAVTLADGRVVAGTRVVVATGARARVLPFRAADRTRTLRSRADAVALIGAVEHLAPGTPVVVVGGGFVGAEVATSLKARGLAPLVLEAAARPLVTVLGEEVSHWLAGLAASAGVELRNHQQVRDVVEDGDALRVDLAGGAVAAPVVVVAVGAAPNVDWLVESGIALDGGVVVDENFRAAPRVAAIGDVARFDWLNVAGTEAIRLEHWQNANDHARVLARAWVSGASPAGLTVPYFWSDQYGAKIQLLGHPHVTDDVTEISREPGRFTALYSRHDLVTGVVTLSQPRVLMLSRVLLEEPTTLTRALDEAPWRA